MSIETMTKIASYTVGAGGTGTVYFNNIPQTYTDLVFKISVRTVASSIDSLAIGMNNLYTGYTMRRVYANGSSTVSETDTYRDLCQVPGTDYTAGTFANIEVNIPNYTAASYKSVTVDGVTENNTTTSYLRMTALTNSSTAPLEHVNFGSGTSGLNLAQYSTFTLYGVKAARTAVGNSIKATGGAISFDGTYVYHTFNTTSLFTPSQPLLADVLIVAGGGGGGWYNAGGGGAGGLVMLGTSAYSPAYLSKELSYSVTVGAGGSGATSSVSQGDGTNSSFGSYIAYGGGGGGAQFNSTVKNGRPGGSGGGAGESGGAGTVGTSTQISYAGAAVGYGNSGGATYPSGIFSSGGGGGAGAAGGAANASAPGNGGNGLTWLGLAVGGQIVNGVSYFAGGGGGTAAYSTAVGTGGYGGGGTGVAGGNGNAGTLNTGGGGGGGAGNGGSASYSGGAGGSGVVIVRYKA